MKPKAPEFGIMFFSASEESLLTDKYRLVMEAARFADQHGFSSVWVPERQFATLGGLNPNPSVLHAAVAAVTTRVALRAGSVVLPLHDPVRVAERITPGQRVVYQRPWSMYCAHYWSKIQAHRCTDYVVLLRAARRASSSDIAPWRERL